MAQNQSDESLGRDYWCFISYRHADNREIGRQWASWLHHELETYEVPSDLVGKINDRGDEIPSRLYPIFRDEEELPADAELSSPIERALQRSRFLVVICSPAAAASRFVDDEVRIFKQLGKADRVLAMIISGEPNASERPQGHLEALSRGQECFPLSLRRVVNAQGEITEKQSEPVGADFRLHDGMEGWTSPEAYRQALMEQGIPKSKIPQLVSEYSSKIRLMKLKIVAGIMGIPLGVLTKRDQAYELEKAKKRAKTLRRWLVVVSIVMVAAIASGIFAVFQWKQATEQKGRAEETNQRAFRLVGRLSDDMFKALESAGRLDLINKLLFPMGQFFAERRGELKERDWQNKRSNLEIELEWTHYILAGMLATSEKKFESAKRCYELAEVAAFDLASRGHNPSNRHYWGGEGLAFGNARLNPVFLTRLKSARVFINEVAAIREQYGEGHIASMNGRELVESNLSKIMNDLPEAIALQNSLDESSIIGDKEKEDNKIMMAMAKRILATAQMQKGQIEDAMPNALQALEEIKEQGRRRAHPLMPPSKALLAELGETRRLLGALACKQKNFNDAEQYYVHALSCFQALAQLGYSGDAATTYARIYQEKGDTMLDVANYGQAQQDYLKALEIGTELVTKSGATPDRSVFLSRVNQRLCWSSCLLGEYQRAVDFGQQASSILNQLERSEKVLGHISENKWEHATTSIRARYFVDRSLAHAYLFNGDDGAAREIYKRYLNVMEVSSDQWRKDLQEDFKKLRKSGADDSKLKLIETLLSTSHPHYESF